MNQHEATQLIADDIAYLGGGREITTVRNVETGDSVILVTMPDDSVLEISVRELVPAP